MIKHLRRPQSRPEDGWRVIKCDCGWEGRTPEMARSEEEIDVSLEELFKRHLPEAERRTHLLVDSRLPDEFVPLNVMLAQADELGMTADQARAAYAAQPTIEGVWIMPIGEAVMLTGDRIESGKHFGSYRTRDGQTGELPVGEVRTPEGRVFRLDE